MRTGKLVSFLIAPLFLILIFFFLSATNVFAQLPLSDIVEDPLRERFTSLGEIASLLLPPVLLLGGMIAFLFIIWGGFKYMTAQGDPKAVASARGTIVSAVIGLLILASIFVILLLVERVLQIKILTTFVPSVYAVNIGQEFLLGDRSITDVFGNFGELVASVVNFALAAGGLVFFAMLIWGGMRYMLARGDDKLIMEARQTVTNAVIGLLIIVSSFAIIKLISVATGADISIF